METATAGTTPRHTATTAGATPPPTKKEKGIYPMKDIMLIIFLVVLMTFCPVIGFIVYAILKKCGEL